MKKILILIILMTTTIFSKTITILQPNPQNPIQQEWIAEYQNVSETQYQEFLQDKTTLYPAWTDANYFTNDGYYGPYYVCTDESVDNTVVENDDKAHIRKETQYEDWLTNSLYFEMPTNTQPNHETKTLDYMETVPYAYQNNDLNLTSYLTWVQNKNIDPYKCTYYWDIMQENMSAYKYNLKKYTEEMFTKNSNVNFLVNPTTLGLDRNNLKENELVISSVIAGATYNNIMTLQNTTNEQGARVYVDAGKISISLEQIPIETLQSLLLTNQKHQTTLTNEFNSNIDYINVCDDKQTLIYENLTDSEYVKTLIRIID